MNEKTAKTLRAVARRRTEGLPERHYVRDSRTNSICVNEKTTRGVYKKLKKKERALRRLWKEHRQ